jgi:hypothetical protein
MSLSVCLLTRDAEQHLERVLGSVAGLQAEVIVADTGSTDNMVQAARALGARVVQVEWHDDFGAAQNIALDHATGDWILWLNPDEELLPQGVEQLPRMLARPEALAYAVRVLEITQQGAPEPAIEFVYPRLFRRQPALRFLGRLHPHFAVPLEELARRQQQQIYPCELRVRRHAYLSQLTPQKLRWAARLLELELQDRPGQLHYLIEYGRHLLWLNDPRGHDILAEAAEQVLGMSDAPAAPTPTVGRLLEYLLTVSPQQSRSRLLPADARQLAQRWFPRSPPLLWCLAQRSFQAGDFRDAAQLLEALVQLGRTGTYDRSAGFDPSIMAEPALVNLGSCYVRLGELDRAEWYFGQVRAGTMQHGQAQQGFALVQELRRGKRPS